MPMIGPVRSELDGNAAELLKDDERPHHCVCVCGGGGSVVCYSSYGFYEIRGKATRKKNVKNFKKEKKTKQVGGPHVGPLMAA